MAKQRASLYETAFTGESNVCSMPHTMAHTARVLATFSELHRLFGDYTTLRDDPHTTTEWRFMTSDCRAAALAARRSPHHCNHAQNTAASNCEARKETQRLVMARCATAAEAAGTCRLRLRCLRSARAWQ
eukprot:TRINITY_DN5432_c0_g1_i8.p1 TRINITY_DN5432_c0_g1~~TRINITY_DN5432_c0_g1_i8.p1  ORF type:complete len:130 (-),score=14.43 TRINITY_DN5432_c0_g1_i8:234-623(-)